MKLSWDAPGYDGGSPLTFYEIYMKNFTMTKFFLVKKIPANTTSAVVRNLRAGAKYKFRIAATNNIGRGRISDESLWKETTTLGMSHYLFSFFQIFCQMFSKYCKISDSAMGLSGFISFLGGGVSKEKENMLVKLHLYIHL